MTLKALSPCQSPFHSKTPFYAIAKDEQEAIMHSSPSAIQQAFQDLSRSHPDKLQCPQTITEESVDAFASAFFEEKSQDPPTQKDLDTLVELRKKLDTLRQKSSTSSKHEPFHDRLEEKIDAMISRLTHRLTSSPSPLAVANQPAQEEPIAPPFYVSDLPDELQQMILEKMQVLELGKMASHSRAMRKQVHDQFVAIFTKVIEVLEDTKDPFIQELFAIARHKQKHNHESIAIHGCMNELFAALHAYPKLKAGELAHFIITLHESAYRQKMNLRQYLGYLNDLKNKKIAFCDLKELQNDELAMRIAVSVDSRAFQLFSPKFPSYLDIAKIAAAHDGLILQHVTREHKNNPELVKIAVQQNGLALFYASDELRSNPEIVKIAARQCESALSYAKGELQGNREMVKTAVSYHGKAIAHATEALRDDFEVAEIALKQTPQAFTLLSARLQKDPVLRKLVSLSSVSNSTKASKHTKISRLFSRFLALFKSRHT